MSGGPFPEMDVLVFGDDVQVRRQLLLSWDGVIWQDISSKSFRDERTIEEDTN